MTRQENLGALLGWILSPFLFAYMMIYYGLVEPIQISRRAKREIMTAPQRELQTRYMIRGRDVTVQDIEDRLSGNQVKGQPYLTEDYLYYSRIEIGRWIEGRPPTDRVDLGPGYLKLKVLFCVSCVAQVSIFFEAEVCPFSPDEFLEITTYRNRSWDQKCEKRTYWKCALSNEYLNEDLTVSLLSSPEHMNEVSHVELC